MSALDKTSGIQDLCQIPGIGRSLAEDLWNIGIHSVLDLKEKNAQSLYERSNVYAGTVQDRCVLYAFRCAVYYANTPAEERSPEKLKWWNWKDTK